jgi:hypothetical protein
VANGIWGDLFPLIVFLFSAGLTVFARIRGWKTPEFTGKEEEPHTSSTNKREGSFLVRHYWGIILFAAITAVLLFAILFAPPRLTGEIPPNPNQPGRPFYSLHWVRDFLRDNFDSIESWSNFLASLFCLVPIGIAIKQRSRSRTENSLLLSSLTLAMLAQWTLAKNEINEIGVVIYIISILGFAYWAWLAHRRLSLDLKTSSTKPAWEIPVILAILVLTSFARFYSLGAVPYGIEGDEAKWTSEAVNLSILGQPDTSGEYHRDALPVSFYLQTPFHRFFGASLLSARVTVAFLSVLASLIFYWLLRQIAPTPIAALGTYLLAVSIFDISASRLANVESFVKLWAVLPLALLALAIRKRAWQVFTLAGLSLALAALTYDTLLPIIGVCLILALIDLWGIPAKEKLKSLAALLAPVLITLPVVIPYFVSRINYYELGKKGWDSDWLLTLGKNFVSILESWFVILRPDFLYNRAGPLLNASLLPWLVLGIVAAIFFIREKVARWLLIWVGMVILPVPLITNSPLGRVYYPALPAIYGLIAFGLFLFWKEIQRLFTSGLKPILIAVSLVPLVWLPLMNFYIYFNEVSEPDDRQMRREISGIASTVTDDETLLVLPVVLNADEPLNNEYQMIELFLMHNLTKEQAKLAYQRIALEKVMPTISSEFPEWKKLIIVLDNESPGAREQRTALTEGLIYCYPEGDLIEGYYFNQFIINDSAWRDSKCTPVELSLRAEDTSHLAWNLSSGYASFLTLLCDHQKQNYLWVEAEDISIGPGWQVQINFAPGWLGSGFIMDNYGSQFLGYEFTSRFTGQDIYVWARTYKRVSDNSPAFINVNDTTMSFVKTADNSLNEWIWERLGPFPNKEIIRTTIARPYNENPKNFMALFLDAIIFTDNSSFSPESDLTEPMPPQIFTVTRDSSSGSIQPDLPPGIYSCRVQINSDRNLVDYFGRIPVLSNNVELTLP